MDALSGIGGMLAQWLVLAVLVSGTYPTLIKEQVRLRIYNLSSHEPELISNIPCSTNNMEWRMISNDIVRDGNGVGVIVPIRSYEKCISLSLFKNEELLFKAPEACVGKTAPLESAYESAYRNAIAPAKALPDTNDRDGALSCLKSGYESLKTAN